MQKLTDSLRNLGAGHGHYQKIEHLVDHLITKRGQAPTLVHYAALVRANASAPLGSAEVVQDLLKEMGDMSIHPDSGLYHSVLQVGLSEARLVFGCADCAPRCFPYIQITHCEIRCCGKCKSGGSL